MGQSEPRGAGDHARAGARRHLAGQIRSDALLCDRADKPNLEAQNQARLIEFVNSFFQDGFQGGSPFTETVLRNLHYITIEGIYPCAGDLREEATDEVEINASFVPGTAADVRLKVPEIISRARDWQNEVAKQPAVPGITLDGGIADQMVPLAADLFYDLIVVHPFRGGNGRVSRAFLHLLLYDMRMLQLPRQMFSYMARRRNAYFRALQEADRGRLQMLYAYIGRGRIEAQTQPLLATVGNSVIGPEVTKRLGRDHRRFLETEHRDALSDQSYFKRWPGFLESLSDVLRRLGPQIR